MIEFEKEVINYLNLPSIPKKEWDGRTAFGKGVAVVETETGGEAYAVCKFDPESGRKKPSITRTFSLEKFTAVKRIYVVPNYMAQVEDVAKMDLDEESKKKAMAILEQADEIEKGLTEDRESTNEINNLPEWVFPEISNKEEAMAWLRSYNSSNRIKGKIPSNEETLKLRLLAIYSEQKRKNK